MQTVNFYDFGRRLSISMISGADHQIREGFSFAEAGTYPPYYEGDQKRIGAARRVWSLPSLEEVLWKGVQDLGERFAGGGLGFEANWVFVDCAERAFRLNLHPRGGSGGRGSSPS